MCSSDLNEVELLMNTQMFQNLLFNFVIFDSHTIPQCYFLNGINLDNATFFYYDNLVIPRLLDYVGLCAKDTKRTNSSLTNPKKLVIIKKLKQLLEENSNLQHSINKHYYADHMLFDKVKFHY